MNLREATENYARAASDRDYYDNRGDAHSADIAADQARHWRRVVDLHLAVAEAALAYMDHQAASVYDPDNCDPDHFLAYAQQRGKLWDAFMEAKDKAKEVTS